MKFSTVAFTLASALVASAADFSVTVGANNELQYSPSEVNVTAGDTIQFTFANKNHTVTQSTFGAPCSPMQGGINSGFMPVSNTSTAPVTFNVTFTSDNSTGPFWFYCAQTVPESHCANGMVFAVNTSGNKTFGAFQAAANATNTSNSTTGASGGAPAPSSGSGSGGSSSNSTGAALALSPAGALGAASLFAAVAGLVL